MKDKDQDNRVQWQMMDGAYFALIHRNHSDNAKAMIDDLSPVVAHHAGRKYKPTPAFKEALGAIIHDLLELEGRDRDTYGYREMKPECFTGSPIGYRRFTDCIHGLRDAGFTDYKRGEKDWSGNDSFATRTKAKANLLAYAAGYGITPSNLADHFNQLPPAAVIRDPIVLKTAKTYTRDGVRMPFNRSDSKAIEYTEQLHVINAYFANQRLTNGSHYAFQRVFSRGDIDGWDLSQGGRVYSVGGSNYQAMPSDERRAILINGERSVEVDVKASHITILHYLTGTPMPDRLDLYNIGKLPRPVVKAFITATLGYYKFHRDWPDEAVEIVKKKTKKKIKLRQYDFNSVKDAVLLTIPLLQGWKDSKFRWGDLQYAESDPMIASVIELATIYDIPAYPLHDSLRVPVSKVDTVRKVMQKQFLNHLGFNPLLDIKE